MKNQLEIEPFTAAVCIVIILGLFYFFAPRTTLGKLETLTLDNAKEGTWLTIMDTPICKTDPNRPWCMRECYDTTSYKYRLCRSVTEVYSSEVLGFGEVKVACPKAKNVNMLGSSCEPIAVD